MDCMDDHLLADVQALLDMGFGDDRILKQIHRACKNHEAISNYERSYVRGLVEEHLEKVDPPADPEPTKEVPEPSPTIVAQSATTQELVAETKTRQDSGGIMSGSRRKMFLLGIVGIIAIGIITAAVSFNATTVDPVQPPPTQIQPPLTPIQPEMSGFSVATDLPSYDRLDLILISGVSDDLGAITISIDDPQGQTIWSETVSSRNGKYSTITIAGGQGWNDSGIYSVEAYNGVDRESQTFIFNP